MVTMSTHTENFLIVSPINAKFCPVSVLVNSGNENVIWEDHVDKPFKKLSAPELHRIRQRYGCLFITVIFLFTYATEMKVVT